MRQLFLHVGLHKTGTSYLQRFTGQNASLLADAGLQVPSYEDTQTHLGFIQTHLTLVNGLINHGPRHFLDSLDWQEADKLLISSEALLHAFRNENLALELIAAAKSENIKLTLVLVLRRQDVLKESVFSEVVKIWYQGTIVDEVHYDYDFNQRVAGLEKVFGQENIRLVLHREGSPRPLSELFIQQLDLGKTLGASNEVPMQNVSFHRRKSLFLSMVSKQNKRLAGFVLNAVKQSNIIEDDGMKYMMSPIQRSDFLSRFMEGNRDLLTRYNLKAPNWFPPPILGNAEWKSPHPIKPEEYTGIMLEALRLGSARSQ